MTAPAPPRANIKARNARVADHEGLADIPAVELRDVRRNFGKTAAVAGISLQVPRGSFTTLLGASGSGKTTTLRMIAGLEPLDSGEIRLGSRVVSSPSTFVPPERRKLGLVFQSYALWPHMTVFDHVAYPLRVQRTRLGLKERVERALTLVDLGEYNGRYPSELSGGQQQRVALARAIVCEPDVLLLDEPLSNLDAELRVHMRRELSFLHHRLNMSTVYVTHDQLEALALSDQIIVMQHGSIIEVGKPREVYERPRSLDSARFIGASNLVYGEAEKSGGDRLKLKLQGGLQLVVPDSCLIASETAEPIFPVSVALTIKPEDIHLLGGQDWPVVPGNVVGAFYHGSHVEASIESHQQRWRIWTDKSIELTVGDLIEMRLDPKAIRLFPFARK